MVKRKPGGRKTQKKRKPKKNISLKTQLKRAVLGITILVFLVVAAGMLVYYLMPRKQQIRPTSVGKKTEVSRKTVKKAPAFEIYPKKEILIRKPGIKPKKVIPGKLPKVAIIIDDLGYDKVFAEKFMSLDTAITFSVLPHSTFEREIARGANAKGYEIMLHLPMEPLEYPHVNPGSGALLMSMAPDRLIDQLYENLKAVPYIKGVNNHMGSRMTAVSTQMYQIFSVLKKQNLYFIDSRTTTETLCKPSARLFQLQFAQRDIFLDNIQKTDAIQRQINKLVLIAGSHGEGIGIAHPYPVTYEVLRKMLPGLRKKVEFVPASALVKTAG